MCGECAEATDDLPLMTHTPHCPGCLGCSIVTERETGKPRGFGFIEFFDIPTAESAIRNLSGKDFKGRTIRWGAGQARRFLSMQLVLLSPTTAAVPCATRAGLCMRRVVPASSAPEVGRLGRAAEARTLCAGVPTGTPLGA